MRHNAAVLTGARVLVTGAAGRVGFPIAAALWLANGNTVFGLARFATRPTSTRWPRPGSSPSWATCTARPTTTSPTAHPRVPRRGRVGARGGRLVVRVRGQRAVDRVGSCVRSTDSCRGFVYCSTGSTYVYQGRRPLREDDPPGIHTTGNYSFSKIVGEAIVRARVRRARRARHDHPDLLHLRPRGRRAVGPHRPDARGRGDRAAPRRAQPLQPDLRGRLRAPRHPRARGRRPCPR